MTHTITPFNHEEQYRGMSCTCGFVSTTGDLETDKRNCERHVEWESPAHKAIKEICTYVDLMGEDFNPDRIAAIIKQAYSAQARELAELREWKRQQMIVSSELEDHKIAKMLGANLGESCNKVINQRVPEVLKKLELTENALGEILEVCRNFQTDQECVKAVDLIHGIANKLVNKP